MAHPVDRYVGARFRSLRELRTLSQMEIAEKLGISYQQVQKYEKGTDRISASRLYSISRILNVQPNYFFQGFEKSDPDAPEAAISSKAARVAGLYESIPGAEAKARLYDLIKAIASSTDREESASGH